MVLASGSGFDTGIFSEVTVLEDSVFSGKKLVYGSRTPERLGKLEVERRELPNLISVYLFHLSPSRFHTITISGEKETFVYRGF